MKEKSKKKNNFKKEKIKEENELENRFIWKIRNADEIEKTQDDIDTTIRDFYADYDPSLMDALEVKEYDQLISVLSDKEKMILEQDKTY